MNCMGDLCTARAAHQPPHLCGSTTLGSTRLTSTNSINLGWAWAGLVGSCLRSAVGDDWSRLNQIDSELVLELISEELCIALHSISKTMRTALPNYWETEYENCVVALYDFKTDTKIITRPPANPSRKAFRTSGEQDSSIVETQAGSCRSWMNHIVSE